MAGTRARTQQLEGEVGEAGREAFNACRYTLTTLPPFPRDEGLVFCS